MINASDIQHSWQNILTLTQAMEQDAAKENWNEVAEQATQRHQVIQKHFKLFAVGPETAEFYYQHLHSFLQKEQQLKELADNARKHVVKQNLTLINNKKASNAYQVSQKY